MATVWVPFVVTEKHNIISNVLVSQRPVVTLPQTSNVFTRPMHPKVTDEWRCHRRRKDVDTYEFDESESASNGLSIRKCPGVNDSISSSSEGKATSGLLFKQVHNMTQMCLHTFHNCLPQSTKMWSTFEIPFYMLTSTKP